MKHKKRYRWFKSHKHLHQRVCAIDGHTWNYSKPRFSRVSMQGLTQRVCHCGAKEIGTWKYHKKTGWTFKPRSA